MLLKQMKTTDLDENKKYVFVISMGAIEQHGPFLPLGTDSYCQEAILEKAMQECPEVIFLPTLDITCSKEHRGFPGTVWLKKPTMNLVLRDIVSSLAVNASDIIFTSWHGGNLAVIDQFIEENKKDLDPIRLHHVDLDPEEVIKKTEKILGGPVDEHAGNTEISMVLASQEKLVTVPPADYPKNSKTADWSEGSSVKEQSADGVVDPHPKWVVDVEQGKLFIELSAEHLKNEIKKIAQDKK